MFMKKLFIIFIILLFTSCSINNNEELNNEISKLRQEKEEVIKNSNDLLSQINENNLEKEIFNNNLRCLDLEGEINKYLVSNSKTLKDTIKVEKIFFSKEYNSCLYVEYSVMEWMKSTVGKDWVANITPMKLYYNRRLFDVLDKLNPIEECIAYETIECEKLDNLIEKIK